VAQVHVDSKQTAEGALPVAIPTSPDVIASVQIEAEARRIVYALATLEYMEVWLQLPEVERIECHLERRSYDRFRIYMICAGKRQGEHLWKMSVVKAKSDYALVGERSGWWSS